MARFTYREPNRSDIAPPRSYLYSIKPIGLGTPYVESLSSYLARLALAHVVPIDIFINKIILPRMEAPYRIGSGDLLRIMNGMSRTTSEILRVLGNLTKQQDLMGLTMLPWRYVIDDRALLDVRKSWCPYCYQQFDEDLGFAYDPLIWSLSVTKVCPIHAEHFVHECENSDCPGKSPNRHFYVPGYCQGCGSWMGRSEDVLDGHEKSSLKPEINAAKQLIMTGQWMMQSGREFKGAHGKTIKELVDREKLSSHQLGALLGKNMRTIDGWMEGSRVQITQLIELAVDTELSLKDFLTGGINIAKIRQNKGRVSMSRHKSRQSRFDSKLLSAKLKTLYEEYKAEPLNLSEMARLVGCSVDTLQRHCPENCSEITSRYRKYQAVLKQHRFRVHSIKVSAATIALAQQGIYPSVPKVQAITNLSRISYNKELLDLWRRTLYDIGLRPTGK